MVSLPADSPLLDLLGPADLEALSRLGRVESAPAGTRILRQGEPADAMLILLRGTARVVRNAVLIAEIARGDVIGERMFSEAPVRSASVESTGDSEVLVLDLPAFQQLLQERPQAALALRSFCEQRHRQHGLENQRRDTPDPRRYLALVAHDAMKSRLIEFCARHRDALKRFPLLATGTTGTLLYQQTGMVLAKKVRSGPLGGDQAIGHLISTGNIRAVLFFRDPLRAHPHQSDIAALARLCDVYQVPFATNEATAEMVMAFFSDTTGGAGPTRA